MLCLAYINVQLHLSISIIFVVLPALLMLFPDCPIIRIIHTTVSATAHTYSLFYKCHNECYRTYLLLVIFEKQQSFAKVILIEEI